MPIPEPPVDKGPDTTKAIPPNDELPDYLINEGQGRSEEIKQQERVLHTQKLYIETKSAYDLSNRDENLEKRYAWFSGKGQWDKKLKMIVESQGRSAAVINRSAVQHNSVSGAERQNRTETKAFAFGTEDQLYSDSLTAILKRNYATNDLKYKNSQMFMNGNLVGEDYMEAYFDDKRQKLGEIRWIRRSAKYVLVDPENKEYDMNEDARFIIVYDFVDVREVQTLYPEIPLSELAFPTDDDKDATVQSSVDADDYGDLVSNGYYENNARPFFDESYKKIKRIRLYEKYVKKVLYLKDENVTNLDFKFTEVRDADHANELMQEKLQEYELQQKAIESQNSLIEQTNKDTGSTAPLLPSRQPATEENFELLEQLEDRISYHMISGRHELEYKEDVGKNFPVVRYCSFFINGIIVSFNELFEYAQKEINSMHSKLESMLKRPNFLNIIEEDSVVAGQDINKVGESGTLLVKPGSNNRNAVKTYSNPGLNYIGAYIQLLQHLSDDLKESSGVKDPSLGKAPGANTAGVTIEALKASTNQIIQPMIDNFNFTKKIQAKTTIEMNFLHVKPEVLSRLVEDQAIQEPTGTIRAAMRGESEVNLETALRELTKMSFDIILDESLSTPNLKNARAQILITAAQAAGVPPPIKLIANLMDMPEDDKQEWLAQVQAVQEQQQPQQLPRKAS